MAKMTIKIVLDDVARAPHIVLGVLLQKGPGLGWGQASQSGTTGNPEISVEFERASFASLFCEVTVAGLAGTKFTIEATSGGKQWWPASEENGTTGSTFYRNFEFLEARAS